MHNQHRFWPMQRRRRAALVDGHNILGRRVPLLALSASTQALKNSGPKCYEVAHCENAFNVNLPRNNCNRKCRLLMKKPVSGKPRFPDAPPQFQTPRSHFQTPLSRPGRRTNNYLFLGPLALRSCTSPLTSPAQANHMSWYEAAWNGTGHCDTSLTAHCQREPSGSPLDLALDSFTRARIHATHWFQSGSHKTSCDQPTTQPANQPPRPKEQRFGQRCHLCRISQPMSTHILKCSSD